MSSSFLPSCPADGDPAAGQEPVVGWVVHAHDLLGSTSDEARRLVRQGAPYGTVVWAKAQTAGRGRRGRTWSSPEGNLHVSVVLHCAESVAPQLGFVAALAVADAVDSACGQTRARLKWPNDVLLEGGKLAGLLLEVEHMAHGTAVVLGVGVNLRHFPANTDYAATSLYAHGVDITAEVMLSGFLVSLALRLEEWRGCGFGHTRVEWSKRGHRHGDALRISAVGERMDAVFLGLDQDGSLLAMVNGRTTRFASAEILLP